jgi:hypothetical protein
VHADPIANLRNTSLLAAIANLRSRYVSTSAFDPTVHDITARERLKAAVTLSALLVKLGP